MIQQKKFKQLENCALFAQNTVWLLLEVSVELYKMLAWVAF